MPHPRPLPFTRPDATAEQSALREHGRDTAERQFANVAGVALVGSTFLALTRSTTQDSAHGFFVSLLAICAMQARRWR